MMIAWPFATAYHLKVSNNNLFSVQSAELFLEIVGIITVCTNALRKSCMYDVKSSVEYWCHLSQFLDKKEKCLQ